MTVQVLQGDMFESGAELLVNPTNCQGIPGALAGVFARKFPQSSDYYREDCSRFDPMVLRPLGNVMIAIDQWPGEDRVQAIAMLTTVKLPGGASSLATIEKGLRELHRMAKLCRYNTIAIPALGCGVGGLDFADVAALVHNQFDQSDIAISLYEPK